MKKLIFTDIDGSKYYEDERGDICTASGGLVSIVQEDNIRAIRRQGDPCLQPRSSGGHRQNGFRYHYGL